MQWAAIHHVAEEAELWTSLFINLWILLSATIIATRWALGQRQTFEKHRDDIELAWYLLVGGAGVLWAIYDLVSWLIRHL
jgi:hypothetical protein